MYSLEGVDINGYGCISNSSFATEKCRWRRIRNGTQHYPKKSCKKRSLTEDFETFRARLYGAGVSSELTTNVSRNRGETMGEQRYQSVILTWHPFLFELVHSWCTIFFLSRTSLEDNESISRYFSLTPRTARVVMWVSGGQWPRLRFGLVRHEC